VTVGCNGWNVKTGPELGESGGSDEKVTETRRVATSITPIKICK